MGGADQAAAGVEHVLPDADLSSLAAAAEAHQTAEEAPAAAAAAAAAAMPNIRILNADGTLSEAPPGLLAGVDVAAAIQQQQAAMSEAAGAAAAVGTEQTQYRLIQAVQEEVLIHF